MLLSGDGIIWLECLIYIWFLRLYLPQYYSKKANYQPVRLDVAKRHWLLREWSVEYNTAVAVPSALARNIEKIVRVNLKLSFEFDSTLDSLPTY